MQFRKHDPRRRAQANGVHLTTSSASLSSFSSSSDSSILPAAPPSGSSQSDLATPDQSVHTSPTGAHKSHLPPDTILPVPRSSSLIPAMGQIPSRSQLQPTVPPPSPVASGSAGSRLKRVFGGRRKKSEDILPIVPTLAPAPMPIGKSRSVMTPASSTMSSPSAPKLPHQPTVSAGPSYHTSPFIRHIPPGHQPISSSNPSADTPQANLTLNPPSSPDQEGVGNVVRRPKKRDSDHDVMKEDWRKSDSTTTSYYTVRPRSVASGGTRTPRPVSMAESLHSTNTVVPAGKRLSALLTEAEFVMTEEDVSHSGVTPLSRKTSPSGSSKTCKRHSISLSFASPLPSNQAATPLPSSEGHSSRLGFKHRPSGDMATLSKTAASGIIGPSLNDNSQSTGSHIKGNLAAWTTGHHPSSYDERGASTATLLPEPARLPSTDCHQHDYVQVERMGRAFGSMGSSTSSSGHSSSSSSIAGTDDFGRNASNLSLASHASQTQTNKGKPRRTPNAPSGAWSVKTVSSTSTGQTDPESFSFTGPTLGTRLRGPTRNNSGVPVAGGLVFGRDLKTCTDETAIDAVRLTPPTSDSSHTVPPVLQERRLPALVFRCAQHLMKWGVEEEGLFRVSGRATHVAKLRSEFDTGADFDMLECAPGDLDPHAVASIFKTFLRELPEPILTHALNPYFEAAMLTETNVRKSIEEQESPVRKLGTGSSLPTGPRDGLIRKAPSLSTLALPNFSSMRPPSQSLLDAFASLLARLPRENRDLLRTVIDVINFVAQRKEIRMPLSNLTLVLCPTLNMSPPIFRVLCEAKGIWSGPPDGWTDDNTDLDVRGDILNAPDSQSMDNGPEQDSTTEPSLPQGDSSEQGPAMDSEQAAGVWDAQVSGGETQDNIHGDCKEIRPTLDDRASYLSATDSRPSTPAWGKGSLLDPWSPPALTSSSDSLTTPSMSSESPSILQVTVPTPLNIAKDSLVSAIIPDFVRTSPMPSSQPVTHAPVTFPRTETAPGTPSSSQHSSHLPSLTTLPLESGSPDQRSKRLKRPSLSALFSKKSISSLRSSRLFSSSSSSSPYFDARDSPSRSTPASPRTPGSISPSIISAPSLLPRRSSSSLPPLLNTQIDSSSLSLAVGLEEDQLNETEPASPDSCADTSGESSPIPRDTDAPLSTNPVTAQFSNTSELAKLPTTQPEPLQPQLSDDSFVSVASAASYQRLSLWEDVADDIAIRDDWARNVLNDFGWSPTTVEHSMTGKV
ncbi:hypothetical protein EDB86DRAFT_3089293 [Lactarius hatsudake]|nr:hypothetical protein EDB86DRAFT_3089293 [Lactarius hatsudake]